MKIMKITAGAALAFLLYWFSKLIWIMFWGFLFKILFILKTLFMVAIVSMSLYVLWKILGHKSTGERD